MARSPWRWEVVTRKSGVLYNVPQFFTRVDCRDRGTGEASEGKAAIRRSSESLRRLILAEYPRGGNLSAWTRYPWVLNWETQCICTGLFPENQTKKIIRARVIKLIIHQTVVTVQSWKTSAFQTGHWRHPVQPDGSQVTTHTSGIPQQSPSLTKTQENQVNPLGSSLMST